ncbi:D-alanyl-D-alanine carboxypeptidase/D-alanyl-D-alanine-endopeptidase [Glycomyces algeriensis]|uniref:D-alanyl-D-alanine carboxypeptidase n=1 Tax=Glycomyces algeriensis TaxID=256037 RepID=A0A9W6G777_9ACTN|nr:D-alanyl-D-alanine carboxypeptidase/D-alanyl-D-alanine-endopeptidase [Glycomyces algeriensis]MDA1368106.1 D-alanyl-D-alanine carboxypeptidase/D-alanyl-D-alanine-endopeptidase [Glycomyces algeriensis]MDR7348913.1 D-alanyl-D-alanine carboxypeptidase/D-alanyl-D-alanine-endopeptidase (penicillin-binding protein 4) [Glycomyces algeriensis]GLI41617.1 D-alanyl-D-alanine carboxypeptidase [Glycomyces algeriensis]
MSLSDNADPKVASSTPHAAPAPQQARARRRRALTRVLAALAIVVTVAAAGGLVWQISAVTSPRTGTLTAPEAYPPASPAPVLAGSDADAPLPDLAAVLPGLLADPRLNGNLSASFADALTGEVLFEQESTTPLAPASSMKVVTAVAAFQHLGAEYRIPTTVVEGPAEDSVVLVAGGDPTLTVDGEGYYTPYADGASLKELADLVLEARGGTAPATVYLDTSVFTDTVAASGVLPGELATSTGPMAPIMVDGGRMNKTEKYAEHYPDPAMVAAQQFADLLGAATVEVGTAAEGAAELAVVHSAPMSALVDSFILTSDNLLSDAVALQTALVVEGEMTWAAMSAAHTSTLESLGVDMAGLVFHDGSGLSPDDRMTAQAFTQMLLGAAGSQASSVFESLPVAGYSGTLEDRFGTAEEGEGVVRGKTGTLTQPTGVTSLTGTLTTADGRQLIFSLISNGHTTGTDAVETAMDEVTTAVSLCDC